MPFLVLVMAVLWCTLVTWPSSLLGLTVAWVRAHRVPAHSTHYDLIAHIVFAMKELLGSGQSTAVKVIRLLSESGFLYFLVNVSDNPNVISRMAMKPPLEAVLGFYRGIWAFRVQRKLCCTVNIHYPFVSFTCLFRVFIYLA